MAAAGRIIETVIEYREQAPCRTADEMEEVCCEKAGAVQCCPKVEPWDGYSREDVLDHLGITLDEKGRDENGNYVVIEFAPRTKACGEKVIDYDLRPSNCCEDVEPVAISDDLTPDILPAGESIFVFWDGGIPPFTVKTTSKGTYLPNGRNIMTINGRAIQLFANETFCGNTALTISDACSTTSKVIRSDQGQWVSLGSVCGNLAGEPQNVSGDIYELIVGKYKQVEDLTQLYWTDGGFYCVEGTLQDGSAEKCLQGPCPEAYCLALESVRPDGADMDTCMAYDMTEVSANSIEDYFCTLADGAVVATHKYISVHFGVCYYEPTYPNGIEGSTSIAAGFYAVTRSLTLFEWVC